MRHFELIRYALRDLFAPRSLWTTGTMIVTIMILAAVALGSYGLALGTREAERDRIRANTHLRCLRVGKSFLTQGRITDAVLHDLKDKLTAHHISPEAIEGLQPYRSCVDSLPSWSIDRERFVSLRGRTVLLDENQEELFLRGRKLRGTDAFNAEATLRANGESVLLAPSALKKLNVDGEPSQLQKIYTTAGVRTSAMEVAGILKEDLPDHYDYVIPEQYEVKLTRRTEGTMLYVLSGAMPDPWHIGPAAINWRQVDAVRKALPEKLAARIERVTLLADGRLKLTAAPVWNDALQQAVLGMKRDDWKELLQKIAETLNRRTGVADDGFWQQYDDDHQLKAPNFRRIPRDLLNVYVQDIDQLRGVADACDEVIKYESGEGTVERDIINRLDTIDETLQASLRVINGYQCVVAGLGFLTLAVVQFMRSADKTSDAGMLRTMGMPRRQLVALVFWQAIVVCFLGSWGGMAVGGFAGLHIAGWQNDMGQPGGFLVPAGLPMQIVLAAVVMSCSSALLATLSWYYREPLSLLRRN